MGLERGEGAICPSEDGIRRLWGFSKCPPSGPRKNALPQAGPDPATSLRRGLLVEAGCGYHCHLPGMQPRDLFQRFAFLPCMSRANILRARRREGRSSLHDKCHPQGPIRVAQLELAVIPVKLPTRCPLVPSHFQQNHSLPTTSHHSCFLLVPRPFTDTVGTRHRSLCMGAEFQRAVSSDICSCPMR